MVMAESIRLLYNLAAHRLFNLLPSKPAKPHGCLQLNWKFPRSTKVAKCHNRLLWQGVTASPLTQELACLVPGDASGLGGS